ncbi:Hypothetical protein Nlim_1086 [Candidatus Nitrosarchaeum limnium SFB1]|uniref:Uncharacterized protein n=1 Tax=Candidatus Nitrosarchaeum limnium SFB1 TaxID=886738 RepID=F3KKS2_9ARCH|nr:Hypothetical protein Nlim_1086 [Candidatus Nitrosarchaeum limnium SFB1]
MIENTMHPEEFKQYSESYKKEFESTLNQSIQTKYDDPLFQMMIQDFSRLIEEGVKSWEPPITGKISEYFKKFTIKKQEIIFGLLPLGEVNACTVAVPESDDFLIIFEQELFTFCQLICKIMAQCFNIMMNLKNVEEFIEIIEKEGILKRFQELILAFLIHGDPGLAPRYLLDPRYDEIVALFRDPLEIFILGHEYSHLLIGHVGHIENQEVPFDKDGIKVMLYEHNQEFEADFVGLYLCLGALKAKRSDISLGYCGIELFFHCDHIIELGLCILKTGNEDLYWNRDPTDFLSSTHPPPFIRKDRLREIMELEFGADNKAVKSAKIMEGVISKIWEKTRPILVQHYLKGTKVSSKWK